MKLYPNSFEIFSDDSLVQILTKNLEIEYFKKSNESGN